MGIGSEERMETPAATVIVCVHNRAAQVTTCLESLLNMEFRDFEVVIVDDGSTDDTGSCLLEFKRSHPGLRLTVVRNERNLGVSAARNMGLDAATGEFVCFTDSDCTVEPGWLGALMNGLKAPGVAAVAGTVLDDPPRTLAGRACAGACRIGQSRWQGRSLLGGNMGFRRECALRYRFDAALTYGHDEDDIAWRLQADGHRIAFVPAAVVNHHHPINLREYLRLAFRQGEGDARFWYKHGVYVGRDLVSLAGALATLPLGLLDARLLIVPGCFALLQVAALTYNEVAFKGKGIGETLQVLPLLVLYHLCKAWSVFRTMVRIAAGQEKAIQDSKRSWQGCRLADGAVVPR
jgi:glycosyltransferase involved in cell wall biosynthesis